MNHTQLVWQERASMSAFVASVWICRAPAATARRVLADPCVSLSLVRDTGGAHVVLRGPETRPRIDHLPAGYSCVTIRLRPGVALRGFSAQKYINGAVVLPTNSRGRFWFGGKQLQFPDFDTAEMVVDQLRDLGYLHQPNSQAVPALSARSYARAVKRSTGLSPHRLHQLQRIHAALRLLKQGVPVAKVATELHFADQSHLTHAAKRFTGHTPRQLLSVPQSP